MKQVLFSFPFYFYLLSQRRNAVLTSVYTFISYCIAVNLDSTSSGTPCLAHEWEDCHNQKCFRHRQIWNNLPTDWKRKGWFGRSLKVLLKWFWGHTFRFSNVFYILNNFTCIKAQLLFLSTLFVIICRSLHGELTVPTEKEVGEAGNAKQVIELALLTQRCQDHLLSNTL